MSLSFKEFINCEEIKDKKEIYTYIKNEYGVNKTIKENPNSYRSSKKIDYVCMFPNCCFRVVCGLIGGIFKIDNELTSLVHIVLDPVTKIKGICNGVKQKLSYVSYKLFYILLFIFYIIERNFRGSFIYSFKNNSI